MGSLYSWFRNVRMKYSSEQAYIAQRMLQERGGWQTHLDYCRQLIIDAVEQRKPRSVRVLGSGWLFDVPIDYLIQHCDSVVLVDIYHPRQVVYRYSSFSHVAFETVDLTCGVVDLAYGIKPRRFNPEGFISAVKAVPHVEYTEDFVISVNLLSQLSVFITDYIATRVDVGYDQLVAIAEAVQQNHLANLPADKSLLITDFEEEYVDEDGLFVGAKPTIFVDIQRDQRLKEWDWVFDSQLTYREDCKTTLKVVAAKI
ncbi:MAG: hypothetical protein H6536_01235 [Bacteroidales bacterium]|nr:hypothetical protein [Bacteroidales bacterium]